MLLGDVGLMGSGMGLVMLALLITMQNSVGRDQLGIATSINQFARSIGQTVGVAVMGAVMTISITSHIDEIQQTSGLPQSEVERLAHNLSAVIEPSQRANLSPAVLKPLEKVLADGYSILLALDPVMPSYVALALSIAATLGVAAAFSMAFEWRFRKPAEAIALALLLAPSRIVGRRQAA